MENLHYKDFVNKDEKLVFECGLFAVIAKKEDIPEDKTPGDYTSDDIPVKKFWHECWVIFNPEKDAKEASGFKVKLENALCTCDDIKNVFLRYGYLDFGTKNDGINCYLSATGELYTCKYGESSENVIPKNEINIGKLYGKFLYALEDNKLSEFFKNPDLSTKKYLNLMMNKNFKKVMEDSIKFKHQQMFENIERLMALAGKTQEEIDERKAKVIEKADKDLKKLNAYYVRLIKALDINREVKNGIDAL